MTNDPLEARIEGLLGCSRAAGPRRILGLGEAPLDAAILEAAFSTRVRAVKASTETPPIKNAAMTRLEAAVAALRPSVQGTERPKRPVRPGSEGIGSPSSPIASTAGDETPIMDSPENANVASLRSDRCGREACPRLPRARSPGHPVPSVRLRGSRRNISRRSIASCFRFWSRAADGTDEPESWSLVWPIRPDWTPRRCGEW